MCILPISNDEARKRVKTLLEDEDSIRRVAELSHQPIPEIKKFLEELLKAPEISDEAKKYIWGKETSGDLKSYKAGEEEGEKHGFWKGVAAGGTAVLLCIGAIFKKRKKKD